MISRVKNSLTLPRDRVEMYLLLNLFALFYQAAASDPEMSINVPQMIQRWGYPVEELGAITEDGYCITIFRIPRGINSLDSGCKRPPVLMDHSLLCDSSEFVMNPRDSSPAMALADAGFDVFLMNHRGTTYSTKHRGLNTNTSKFWEFTMDEYGQYDNPAAIDLILSTTGERSIYYIGHSQGALLGMTMLAERPEYNQKIRSLFLIAPANGHSCRGFCGLLSRFYALVKPMLDVYVNTLGSHEVAFASRLIPQTVMDVFCTSPYIKMICQGWTTLTMGPPAKTFNYSRWPIYVSHLPSGTSTWNLLHWGQLSSTNIIAHFDHSPNGNMKRYGQLSAPPYNLAQVRVPVHIFWSDSDWLARWEDVESAILPQIRSEFIKGIYEIDSYDHLDYVTATDNAEKVFSRIIGEVRKQEKEMCEQ
ncbi:hypothetical protein PMAYCL1PPCAC_20260 [Pristionchus mayeri]|uniref:Lipase n=1 Tax=Pristionchus mayeri TaxID=1317129 RepID=A0AAN5CTE1_9BILA|nr:hypothetical protein PMAYCL1PPCAC_20260 [Pristionchus mayeri]